MILSTIQMVAIVAILAMFAAIEEPTLDNAKVMGVCLIMVVVAGLLRFVTDFVEVLT